jgi:hypothetical protein
VKDPIPNARELIANTRAFAKNARAEAHHLHFILARRAESRALLKLAGSAETFAERLSMLTDNVTHARPLLVDDEL